MGQNQLTEARPLRLLAEEGESLASGELRLYAMAAGCGTSATPAVGGADEDSPVAVGCVDLYAYDPVNRRCAVGIAVANAFRRQGYALAMLRQLELTAALLGLHQLYADIAATNHASLALFDKAGYTRCGHFRQWVAEAGGTYTDTIRMQQILE